MIQKAIKESGNKILTDLITLDTPGKASVRVIILADPVSIYIVLLIIIYFINLYKFDNCFQDGHEICFVDDEGFRQLSVPDYPSEAILDRFIQKEATDNA